MSRPAVARRIILGVALLSFVIVTAVAAQDEPYKKYNRRAGQEVFLSIITAPDEWEFIIDPGLSSEAVHVVHKITKRNGEIVGDDVVHINAEGITIGDVHFPVERLTDVRITPSYQGKEISIEFLTPDTSLSRFGFKRSSGDRVVFDGDAVIAENEFVRGHVLCFGHDVRVFGEVNRSATAVFGNAAVYDGAVVRGDLISLYGDATLTDEASVYGRVISAEGVESTRRSRAHRWQSIRENIALAGRFVYNRVDGANLMLGLKYDDIDSLLPSFHVLAGYAFSSERFRYEIGLTQTLLRGRFPLQVGGEIYTLLKSDDDKLINDWENTAFAFFFGEDWKDYYEAQGGYAFLRAGYLDRGTFEIGYLNEDYRWFDAHRRLWSVFGGGKDFRGNFSTVPYDMLQEEVNNNFRGKNLTSLLFQLNVDNREEVYDMTRGWCGFARFEHSLGSGSFDFDRFETRLKRFQPINRRISLHLLAAYGYADGDIFPLNRYFFLGGLGTLRGYRHKEYLGKEYILLSAEYRFRLPHSRLTPFLFYDGGKIARGDRLGSGDEWKSALSFGVDFQGIRLFIGHRLDAVNTDDFRFYARFSQPL